MLPPENCPVYFTIHARLKKAYALCQTLGALSVLPCRVFILYHADAYWHIAYAFSKLVLGLTLFLCRSYVLLLFFVEVAECLGGKR